MAESRGGGLQFRTSELKLICFSNAEHIVDIRERIER